MSWTNDRFGFMQLVRVVFMFLPCMFFLWSIDLSWSSDAPHNQLLLSDMEQEFQFLQEETVGTLTRVPEKRRVPASVTTITARDIRESGARSLNELLERYAPGVQWISDSFSPPEIGVRGISSNDKWLLLVNGRTFTVRTQDGTVLERDLAMLGDIKQIDVIRGPGSAVYGLGAVSMVVNIITFNAKNFEGTDATLRGGLGENFFTAEVRHTQKIGDVGGLFVYGGVSGYQGAANGDAPFKAGTLKTFPDRDPVATGDPIPTSIRDKAATRDLLQYKFHGQLTLGNFEAWIRFTQGGKRFPTSSARLNPLTSIGLTRFSSYAYQQITALARYRHALGDGMSLEYLASYDTLSFVEGFEDSFKTVTTPPGGAARHPANFREDEYFGRLFFRWEPNGEHKLVVGSEISHEEFGLGTIALSDVDTSLSIFRQPNNPPPRWSTQTYSFLAEHQWNPSSYWTTFIGGRLDKNTFTEFMFSPRLAAVFSPTDEDTVKLILARSQRMPFAAELKRTDRESDDQSEPEMLDSVELSYQRRITPALRGLLSLYYLELDAIGFEPATFRTRVIGEQRQWGFESEVQFEIESLRVRLSHHYSKLVDLELKSGVASSFISVKPNGFGDDKADFSNHITKLVMEYQFLPRWTFLTSFIRYWGFPGSQDFLNFRNAGQIARGRRVFSDANYTTVSDAQTYLNLGLEFRWKQWTMDLHGHYLLGLFDEDLNKRIILGGRGDFRDQAPAVSFLLRYGL